jgi:polyisoprenoid-binding protein YceI
VEVIAEDDYLVKGQLGIRRASREVVLKARCLGRWATPWWEDGVDKGPKTLAGFYAETEINRHDFGVSWNSVLEIVRT